MVSNLLLIVTTFVRLVYGHSWVERASLISSDGFPTSNPGYIRGYVQRTSIDPLFTDVDDTYLLPPDDGVSIDILATDFMCKDSQLSWNYSAASPPLKAPSGSQLVLQYNENGHITMPQNNPPGKLSAGTVSVYGVAYSETQDTFLDVYNTWNTQECSNERLGRLLVRTSFDDGRCYQYSTESPIALQRQALYSHPYDSAEGANLWCNTYVQLPGGLLEGSWYTMYWVWDWPTSAVAPDIAAKPEVYTSCLDILITAAL